MGFSEVKSLSPKALEHLEWYILPKSERGCSIAQWCEANGVDVRVARSWRASKAWDEALDKAYSQINVSADRVQQVIDALHEKAAEGDTKAAQLYLQYTERLKPPTMIVEHKNIQEMTDEELDQVWQGMRAVPNE